MRLAVIGAGIVGVTTAYELAQDGHEVTVFERRASVAEESSFANGGVLAPGHLLTWSAPGLSGRLLRRQRSPDDPTRLAQPIGLDQWRWLWRWWRASATPRAEQSRLHLHRLARYSQQRQKALTHELRLDYEQADGYLILLRTPLALTQARESLKQLAESGVGFRLVDATRALALEPGLNPEARLHAAIHLPSDGVGNCRQFAQLMRGESQRLGVQFRFQRTVLRIEPGSPTLVHHAGADQDVGTMESASFDGVVVCAALGAPHLLRPLGLRLPLAAVHGHSITAPLRIRDGYPDLGPRAALRDQQHQVTITRLGQRVRVSGSAELGNGSRRGSDRDSAVKMLYKVLDEWFPGCAQLAQVQSWTGARPTLPDGPPVLGASGSAGVWLNLGHGASGWALSCGSARVLADQIGGRTPAIELTGLGVERLRH